MASTPTDDDNEELLLSCRYGDLDDVRQFVEKFGQKHLSEIHDEHGNTILHMICGNGHSDILDYILPIVIPALLSQTNDNGSTPLHWAALNAHLSCVQKLVLFPEGPGVDLIDIKNLAGHSPLTEAELTGWDEGAQWLVEKMTLEEGKAESVEEQQGGEEVEEEPSSDGIVEEGVEINVDGVDGKLAELSFKETES